MFLASFRHDGRDRVGIRSGAEDVRDISGNLARLGLPEGDLLALIEAGPEALAALARALESDSGPAPLPAAAVEWHPPVRKPGKIVGVALNNSASDARRISGPSHPMFFLKPRSSLLGHRRDIEVRAYYGGLHPEPELAVVIGRVARDLDPRTALDAVFGYTILNDLTGNAMRAEDRVHYYALYASDADPAQLERREQHLSYAARYKGTDGFAPLGPWLATRDEIPDPQALDVTCTVGGEIVAEDSTRYLTYSVAEVLAFLSRFQTLEPGDIISMGTAFRAKEGASRSLHTADLQRVDGPVEVSISGLGTLVNGVRRVAGDLGEWRLR
jgi:2-keto-4-pentenoate hydratase/2-oxohepta-3-ene-1,7-dioic acid hydratase in catechol pathway